MDVIRALQSVGSPALDRIVLLITQLGSEQVYVALLVIVYLGVDAVVGRRIAITFLASFYANEQIKQLVDRPRPFEIDPSVLRSQAARATAPGASFPSGHAQAATVFYGSLAAYLRRRWLSVVSVVVVVLISLSRLYLGVHMPIDVVGGIGIGLCFVAAGLAIAATRPRLATVLVWVLGLGVPFALHLVFPTDNSGVAMGAMAAFLTGPMVIRHDTSGRLAGRVVLVLIALALVFAAQFAISALVPDAVRHGAIPSFVRYLVLGYLGTVLAPYLGRLLGLTPLARSRS